MICRTILGAALALGFAGSAHAVPAELHIVDLARGADDLEVEICPESGDHCVRHRIARGAILRLPEVSPGSYAFTVRDGERQLERFTYGIGTDAAYSLALYGIAGHPAEFSWWAWLKKWLGGSEERQVSGYSFHHRMLSLDPEKPGGPGEMRLVNYAPGAVAISGHLDWKTGSSAISGVRWDSASKPVSAQRSGARLTTMLGSAKEAAGACDLDLLRGTRALVYVAAIEGATTRLVPDFRKRGDAAARCEHTD